MRIGGSVLAVGAFLGAMLLVYLWHYPDQDGSFRKPKTQEIKKEPLNFSLSSEKPEKLALCFPKIEEELIFSTPLPRPNGILKNPPLLIRCKKKEEVSQVSLPARVGLKYENGLMFAPPTSPFWMELQRVGEKIEAALFAQFPDTVVEIQRVVVVAQETPLQKALEFPEGSPFRVLGKSRWLGRDLFLEHYGEKPGYQRIEIETKWFNLAKGQWLVWEEGSWKELVGAAEKTDLPIARIEKVNEKQLVFEGWGKNGHVRLCLEPIPAAPKVRGEELFTTLRIRSEKQISCMIEKQCLILSVGDWIVKGEGRWNVLKKQEQREAFQKGELVGELFILEKIEPKQKIVRGSLFDISRSQMTLVELSPSNQGKSR